MRERPIQKRLQKIEAGYGSLRYRVERQVCGRDLRPVKSSAFSRGTLSPIIWAR